MLHASFIPDMPYSYVNGPFIRDMSHIRIVSPCPSVSVCGLASRPQDADVESKCNKFSCRDMMTDSYVS